MTQGLVTVQSGGKVVMKVVAGCDGYNARKLANKLRKSWPVSIDEAYKMALEIDFGDPNCLVVITESDIKSDEGNSEIHPRFRETFQKPRFNPRWENGTAEYTVVTNV